MINLLKPFHLKKNIKFSYFPTIQTCIVDSLTLDRTSLTIQMIKDAFEHPNDPNEELNKLLITLDSTLPQLHALDDQNLLARFAKLDFDDLLTIAEVDSRFQQLIQTHIIVDRYHLNKHPLSIFLGWNIFITSDSPLANDYNTTLRILRTFGDSFKQISVHFVTYKHQETLAIFDHINTYCTNAEQEIVLYNVDERVLMGLQQSFRQANSVIVKGLDSLIDLNDMFPRMARFELNIYKQPEFNFLDDYFLRLKHFELNMLHGQHGDFDLKPFFQWNRRLEGLSLRNVGDFELLRFVNEVSQCLEDLTIENRMINLIDTTNNENIRFEKVTTFKLALVDDDDEQSHRRVPSIEFDRLESFELSSIDSASVDDMIDYIIRNNALNRVSIENGELSMGQLMRLVQELPELTELKVELNRHMIGNDLKAFLAHIQRSNVDKITISIDRYGVDKNVVRDIFASEWTFKNEHKWGLRRFMSFDKA